MEIAFLGIGQMGHPMAARLLKAGFDITVYNRVETKCLPLQDAGAHLALTPAEAVESADIVFTMLSDDVALRSVMNEPTIQQMKDGAVHISMSTISTALAVNLARQHEAFGSHYLACPVFGRPEAAAAGELRLCLSGNSTIKDKIKPYLLPLGEVWYFGEQVQAANVIKLAGNFMVLTTIELLAEAFSFIEKHGQDPSQFFEMISNTMFAGPTVKTYGQLLLKANFDKAGFTARLASKDIGLVQQAASVSELPLPIASIVQERLLRALAQGRGEQDATVIGLSQREDAGLA